MGKSALSRTGTTDHPDPLPSAATNEGRILRAARQHIFTFGYSSFTMDELAHELGMSKKTLYVHFSGKEAIVDQLFDRLMTALRARLEVITTDPALPFVQKLAAMIDTIGTILTSVNSPLLRDLQRFAPKTYQKIEANRAENIPLFFGRLIRHGIASGRVRPDIDPDFATQFWLHAIHGLEQPSALERTHLTARQTLEKAVDLFFGGLLTPIGRKDYEKLVAAKK